MHVNNDLKGRVHRLEQRSQSREGLKNLHHLPDFDSFDVEFSPSAQVIQQRRYTFGGKVYDSKRSSMANEENWSVRWNLTARNVSFSEQITYATAKEGVSVGQFTTPQVC